MRKSVLFLTVAMLAVAGCKSKRELAARSDVRASLTEQSGRETRESGSRDSSGARTVEILETEERSKDSETETRITEYDTSKPVDERTGRPPVAKETLTVRRTKDMETKGVLEKRTEEGVVSEQTDRDVKTSMSAQSSEASTSELHEIKKRKVAWPWWLLVVACGVGWWAWRGGKRV